MPEGVLAVEARGAVEPDPLEPAEEALVTRAVAVRRLEFARGRSCARRALAALDRPPVAVTRGRAREPLWPPGITGSITHCRDYCCAALAPAERWAGVGIDAEVLRHLKPRVQARITTAAEARALTGLDRTIPWEMVVFSAKEALFKAWFPATRRRLDFYHAEISLDPDRGRFRARLLIEEPVFRGRPVPHLDGRFVIDGPRVMAAVVF